MGQDIRKMMRDYTPETTKLSEGHETRFEARLKALEAKPDRNMFFYLKVAAIVVVLISVGWFAFYSLNGGIQDNGITAVEEENVTENVAESFTLGDISPDLKKIESYYTTGINVQLASLQVNEDNKELVDGYMQRLSELDIEYQVLNKELNEVGPNEATITALVDNLQLRLELLFKLKNKLKELKKQNNENYTI
ncbi:MAG: hypothetical protein KJO39_09490 [Bacteroidia bacterium]|nr:hypothetical protein [Bacteroidia bacterium]NNF30287.1 hypothetical protein [Flavobacteriaceae bacterium]NNJ80966.1 hypothetical protein [Flavobacteriaceae bacterium]NNM08648.1 hypothetical protein [Flavobacteriaceae bacterium]